MVRLLFELKICLNSFASDRFSVNDILEDGVVEGLRYIILKAGAIFPHIILFITSQLRL